MAAKKRQKDQILRDRARIAELKFQNYTDAEIRDIIAQETGTELSRRQITYDINKVREEWRETRLSHFNALIMEELHRLDSTERMIWQAMRDSAVTGKQKETIRRGEDGVVTIDAVEKSGIDPRFIAQILRVQEERRKLLGLYAPQQIGVHKEVTVKGYVNVSPDEWPDNDEDIIEGEIIRRQIRG